MRILLSTLLVGLLSGPAVSQHVTGYALGEMCKNSPRDAFMYVAGVADTIGVASRLTGTHEFSLCVPSRVTVVEIVNLTCAKVQGTALQDLDGAAFVWDALMTGWPCR